MIQPTSLEKREFVAQATDEGKRLDLFLSFYNNDWTRTFVKKQIESNLVNINDKVEFRSNYKIKEGDRVEINAKLFTEPTDVLGEDIQLDIIFEDKDLIIINKPVGMPVHPATGNWSGTLVNAIVGYLEKPETVGDKLRSGLIHRLDKDTSGVIMVAKTNEALWYYSKLFSEKKVHKSYYAIVRGDITRALGPDKVLTIRNFLGRNPKNRKKFAVVEKGGRLAISDVSIIKVFGEIGQKYSWVSVKPKTGRTHQIRVHLSHLGFPIVGDTVYGGELYKRLMLHASAIEVPSPKGKILNFNSPIPLDFLNFVSSKDSQVDFKDLLKDVVQKDKS